MTGRGNHEKQSYFDAVYRGQHDGGGGSPTNSTVNLQQGEVEGVGRMKGQ